MVVTARFIRATEKLHELSFIEKMSLGRKAYRATYLPNWDCFHAIVQDFNARMKSGDAPATPAGLPAPKVAQLRQTLLSSPSKANVWKKRSRSRSISFFRHRARGHAPKWIKTGYRQIVADCRGAMVREVSLRI